MPTKRLNEQVVANCDRLRECSMETGSNECRNPSQA
jgi:hypothetical protein